MKELREAKRSYKNGYEQLQKCRNTLLQTISSLDITKVDLASAYQG